MIETWFVFPTLLFLIVAASDDQPLSTAGRVWVGLAGLYAAAKIHQMAVDPWVNFSNDVPLGALHKYAVGRIEAMLLNAFLFCLLLVTTITWYAARQKK